MAGFSRGTKSSSDPNPSDVQFEWIDTDSELSKFVERALVHDEYFLDTEFHREKTYFPQLALVQVSIGEEIVLIDPLKVDVSLLRPLLEGEGLCVLHAGQQDLDVLTQSCGFIPRHLFDTQLCAGFLGYSQPALSALLQSFFKVALPKGDRLTDWMRRPLTRDQLVYAALDVHYLPRLYASIVHELDLRGRLGWAQQACEELRVRPNGPTSPDDAWLRVKDVRTLKGRSRWVARSVARWRELRARELDIPPRHVLSDIAVLGIAQKAPRNPDELLQSRGVDSRHARGAVGESLLRAISTGVAEAEGGDLNFPVSDAEDVDKSLRPAVTLVSAWITELARQSELDPALLGTRRDIVDLISGAAHARMAHGWRADIVGRDVSDLVEGRKALTFTPERALRLVDVPMP